MVNVYQRCVKALSGKEKGDTLSLDELKGLIMIHLGSQEVTIQQALKTMGLTGLLKDLGNFRFEVN